LTSRQRSLKSLIHDSLTPEEVLDALEAMDQDSDRAVAVVGATFLDEALRRYVCARFVVLSAKESDALFEPDMPLGSFSAKIKIAHALGLIGTQTRRDLDQIRGVRNVFAHSQRMLTFDTQEISAACYRLASGSYERNWTQPRFSTVDDSPRR